jgi:hypothetical protein
MDADSNRKVEGPLPPETSGPIQQVADKLPWIDSSLENPAAFAPILRSLNDLLRNFYNRAAYRIPITTKGKIVDVKEGSGAFHYFGLVESGNYLPAKIKDDGVVFHGLQEGMTIVAKGFFNLETQPKRPFSFEIRFNVIEFNYSSSDTSAITKNRLPRKQIPDGIRSVGLITSPYSDAIPDFHKGLKQAGRWTKVELYEVNLLDPRSIASGIARADSFGHDVLVLTRGGGSDLHIFNDPVIVGALSSCKTFTVAGIGHANNRTDCDEVADLSVATPTSAGVQIRNWVTAKYYSEKKANEPEGKSHRFEKSKQGFSRKRSPVIPKIVVAGLLLLILSLLVRGHLLNWARKQSLEPKAKVNHELKSRGRH